MKTVKDYLNLGLVFVSGDKIFSVTGDSSSNELDIFGGKLCEKKSSKGAVKIGVDCYARERWTPSSFAWRNNDGVKHEYKGLIEAVLNNGNKPKAFVSELTWLRGFGSSVVKWRPVVLQSDNAKNEMQEKFLSALYDDSPASKNVWNAIREQFCLPVGIDSPELREAFKSFNDYMESNPKFTIKEEAPSRAMTVNIEGREYLIPSRTPTVSPKEDKPMKPVYTAEMHAKGELPPVGSEVKVCIEESGNHDGKAVTVKAAFVNKDGKKIVAIENDRGNCACYIVECIKPIIKTIKVNGFDVPAPMSEAPKNGRVYFLPDILRDNLSCLFTWSGGNSDFSWLSKGIMHSTKSAAIAHAKAMLGIDPNA